MSTCGEPCDGCPNRAEHHLCDACCHDEVNAIQKENRELRAEVERLRFELRKMEAYSDGPTWLTHQESIATAFQRGAEAMREAVIQLVVREVEGRMKLGLSDDIRDLPIPGDK